MEVEKLEEKPHFYQFHLSRVADLRAVKIIFVIHHILKNETQDSLKKISAENGFEEMKQLIAIWHDIEVLQEQMEMIANKVI